MLNRLLLLAVTLLLSFSAHATNGSFVIAQRDETPSTILVDSLDWTGVKLAARDFSEDVQRVCGKKAPVSITLNTSGNVFGGKILVGTLGHSPLIDSWVKAHKVDVSKIRGQWESYLIDVVDGNLVVVGSDKRGTIYGIYELSREIGVSPWYWWADVPVQHREEIVYDRGRQIQQSPKVKYRGIFLNDEAPCLTTWVKNTFGTNYGDHRFPMTVSLSCCSV